MKAKFKSKNFQDIEMSDSDSADDAVVEKVLVWENNDTVMHAGRSKLPSKQPMSSVHNRRNNMTNFRDEIPRNFSKQHYLEHNYSQINVDRGNSPISMRSDTQSVNFRGFSQPSIVDGTESIISDAPSNISCAVDIVSAIKVGQYSSAEAKMITDAVLQRFGKKSLRRGGIRKNYKTNKRALKKVIHAMMKAFEEDQTEQSSNCSTSSEEYQTARSEYQYRSHKNISSGASLQNYRSAFELGPPRSNNMLSRAVRTSSVGVDKTAYLTKDNLRNSNGLGTITPSLNSSRFIMPPPSTNIIPSKVSRTKQSMKDSIIEENVEKDKNVSEQSITHDVPISHSTLNFHSNETNKEMVEEVGCVEKVLAHSKTIDELGKEPEQSENSQSKDIQLTNTQNNANDEENFVFTKPGATSKTARMSNPINDSNQSKNQTSSVENASDLTKSSFLKRKLFTQSLDITKIKENGDSDDVLSNSPLVNIYKSNKKTQKSSLTRSNDATNKPDQQQILELMKKIVTPEEMNIITEPTVAVKHSENDVPVPKVTNPSDNANFSDTYTDEEDLFHFKTKSNDTCIEKPVNNTENANKTVPKPMPEIAPKINTLNSNQNVNSNFSKKPLNVSLKPTLKKINKPLNGSRIDLNRRKANSNNVIRRAAAAFWETDTDTENDKTFNDTLEKTEASVPNVTNNISVTVHESIEKTLDSLYDKNPDAYKNHMLKVIKNLNPPMRMKTLIVKIEKCILGNKPDTSSNNTTKNDDSKNKNAIKTTKDKTNERQVTKNTNKNSPKVNKSVVHTTKSTPKVDRVKVPAVLKPQNKVTKSKTNSKAIKTKSLVKTNSFDVSNNSLNAKYFTRSAARNSILDSSYVPVKLIQRSRRTNKENNNSQQKNDKEVVKNNKATPIRKVNETITKSRQRSRKSTNAAEQIIKQKSTKENSKPIKRKLSISPLNITRSGRGRTEVIQTPNKKLRMEPPNKLNKVEIEKSGNKVEIVKLKNKCGFDKPFESVLNSIKQCNGIDDDCRSILSTTSTSISMRKRVLMCVP